MRKRLKGHVQNLRNFILSNRSLCDRKQCNQIYQRDSVPRRSDDPLNLLANVSGKAFRNFKGADHFAQPDLFCQLVQNEPQKQWQSICRLLERCDDFFVFRHRLQFARTVTLEPLSNFAFVHQTQLNSLVKLPSTQVRHFALSVPASGNDDENAFGKLVGERRRKRFVGFVNAVKQN